jgi:hypothetical protein
MAVELIKGLAQIRDGLTLIAFLSLVLLVAFRTKRVPEMFFGLVRDKLTRQQFAILLHRFMIYCFIAFLALTALAALSQVLAHWTQPGALTIGDLRRELANAKGTEDAKIRAEGQYSLAMNLLSKSDFDGAIKALHASLGEVPTLTAQEMLTYLYKQRRDYTDATEAWEGAVKLARSRSDVLALARLDNDTIPASVPDVQGEHDLIGPAQRLPKGGDKFENAPALSPGLYRCEDSEGCLAWWFGLDLQTGQRVVIRFRSSATGGEASIALFGTNGQWIQAAGDYPESSDHHSHSGPPSTIWQMDYIVPAGGAYYLRTVADPGAVYRLLIQ